MKILYNFVAINFFILSYLCLKADCTVSSSISSTNFLGTYGNCTGIITIPSGVDLNLDGDLDLTGMSISKFIIASGGQLVFNAKSDFKLPNNCQLVISQTSPTTGSASAIYNNGVSCNNNLAIYFGSIKFSACTGSGNVCLIFADLVAAGGTAQPITGVIASGTNVNGSNACFPFGISVSVTGANTINSYTWSQTSGPGTATITNGNTATPTISSATLAGSYTFNVAVVVSAIPIGSNCTSNAEITVNSSITLSVYLPILATGGGTPQIAAGDSYTLVGGDVTVTGTAPSYSWTENGEGFISSGGTSLTPTYSSNNPQDKGNTVVLTLTASNPGCSDTANFNILVSTKLPITLQDFTVSSINCTNVLQWNVADAKNFKEFEIEHSKTGSEFNTISSLQAKAEIRNDGLFQNYTFTDKINKNKNQFYRLKMIDLDGNFKYSQVISVKNECLIPTVDLSPNPLKATSDFQIELSNFGLLIHGKMIDISGRTIQSIKLNNGINKIAIDPLTQGMYWLALQDELNNQKVVKFSVIK